MTAFSTTVRLLALFLSSLGLTFGAIAQAEDYPSRQIRMIVPFVAGAGTDLSARVLAEALSERLGRPVVVENRAGGGGTLGSGFVAAALADGYTLLYGEAGGVTIQPTLQRSLSYTQSSFTYLAKFAETGMAYVVSSSVPATTVEELTRYAAENPNRLRYGSSGVGTSTHLATVLFVNTIRARMEHVPYQGVAQMVNDILGARIEFGLMTPAAVAAHRNSDRIRILGISAPTRHPSLPSVPTAREAGIPNAEVTTWYGLMAPAGLPPAIRERLEREITAIAADPAVIERVRRINLEVVPVIGTAFEELVRRETETWRRIIEAERITVE